jgi:hypothetical protein
MSVSGGEGAPPGGAVGEVGPARAADERLARRLAEGEPLRFDCPMCARVQKLRLLESRCESCGARLRVFGDVEAARRALEDVRERSRHLRELGGGLYLLAAL